MRRRLLTLVLTLPLMSGCFMLPVDQPPPPPLTISVPPEFEYITVPVERGDIKQELRAIASYTPSKREFHYFPADGIPVLGIYVTAGQEVSQGDLIAELDVLELENWYEELSRNRDLSRLELSELEEKQAILSRQAASAGFKLDNSSFIWSRDTLRLTIANLDRLIEYVEQRKVDRHIQAAIDGVVTSAMIYFDGMISTYGTSVATVSVDLVISFFVTGDAAEHMKKGDRFEMILGDDVHLMEVIDPDEFNITVTAEPPYAYLTFTGIPPEPGFDTTGIIYIPLGEIENVLFIPVSHLNRTEERSFVYVLDDNGLRTVRDVETGFEGDGLIEIKSGLSEGELVIQ
ncbi:MAG: efflux RND transporter periplasmic adaptor subunit [Oscillospiraceae bacterium]|nr:efflux RND transporter periplasmic adaptor subunit [Oscillospiraceae bacterium]